MGFMTCVTVVLSQVGWSPSQLFTALNLEVVKKPMEVVKLSVPSLLYIVQNNLLYYALSNLDATPYQVCYQLKILTSAVFSVLLLGKRMSGLKWLALLILTAGVAIVKVSQSGGAAHE